MRPAWIDSPAEIALIILVPLIAFAASITLLVALGKSTGRGGFSPREYNRLLLRPPYLIAILFLMIISALGTCGR